MVDLHSHILCEVDDGARSMEESLAIGRAASQAGVRVVVATPHIRTGQRSVEVSSLPRRVSAVNQALREQKIALVVETGGEVEVSRLATLDAAEIEIVALARSRYVLVETPYDRDPIGASFESLVRHSIGRGIRPVLAHPERNPQLATVELIGRLVADGALVQITASSLFGEFGRQARAHAVKLIRAGLAHVVASDAHGTGTRISALGELARHGQVGGTDLDERLVDLALVYPAALIANEDVLGPLPALQGRRQTPRWRHTLQRVFTRR